MQECVQTLFRSEHHQEAQSPFAPRACVAGGCVQAVEGRDAALPQAPEAVGGMAEKVRVVADDDDREGIPLKGLFCTMWPLRHA